MNKTNSRPRRLIPSSQKQPNTPLALVPHPPKSIPAILISKNSTSVDSDSDLTLSLKSPDEPVLNGVNKAFPSDTQETASTNQSQIRARTYNVTKKPHRRVTWETSEGDEDVKREKTTLANRDEDTSAVSLFGDATENNGGQADDPEDTMDFLSPNDYTDPYALDIASDESDDDLNDEDDQQTPLSTKSDLTNISTNRAAIKSYLSRRSVISSKTNQAATKAMLSSGPADENSPKRTRNGPQSLLGLRKEDTFVVVDKRNRLGTVSPSEDLRRRKALALAKANARHLLKKRSDHHFYDKSNESHYNFRTRSNSQGNQNRKRAYIENTGQEVINDRGEKISFHWQESQGSAKGRNRHVPRGPKAIEKLHHYKKQRARHKYSPVMFTKSAPDKKEKSDVKDSDKNSSQKRSKTATIRKNDDENVNEDDDSTSTTNHHQRNEVAAKPETRFVTRPKEAFVDSSSHQSDSDIRVQRDISDIAKRSTGRLNSKQDSDKENAKSNNTQSEARYVSIHKYSKPSTGAHVGNASSREESFTDHEGDSKPFTNNSKMPHPPSLLDQNKSNFKVPSKSKHNLPSKFNSKQQNGTGSHQASHPGLINDKTTIIVGHHSNSKVGHSSDSNLDLKFVPEKNERVPTKAVSLSNINDTRANNGAIQTTTNAKPVSTTADNDPSTNAGRKLTSSNGKTSTNLRSQVTHKQDAASANSRVPDAQKIPSTPSTDIITHETHSYENKTVTNSRGTNNQNEPLGTKSGNRAIGDSQAKNMSGTMSESKDSTESGINCKTIKAVENRDNNTVDINLIAGNVHQPEKQRSSSNIEIDLARDNTNKTNNITQSKTTQKDCAANHQRSDKQTLKLTDHEDESVNKAVGKISDGAEIRSGNREKSNIHIDHAKDKILQVSGVTNTQTKENSENFKEGKGNTAVSEGMDKNNSNNSIDNNHFSKLSTSSKDAQRTSNKMSLPLKSQEPSSNAGFDQNNPKFKAPTEHLNNQKVQNEHVNNNLNKKTNVLHRKSNRETNQAPTTDQSNRDAAGTSHHIDSHSVNKTARRGIINGETDNRKQFDHMVMRETQQRMTSGEGPGDDLIYSEKGEQPGRDNAVAVTTHQIKENNMEANDDVKSVFGKGEKIESVMTQDGQNLSDPQGKRHHSGTGSAHTLDKVSNSNANETKLDLVQETNAEIQNLCPVQYDIVDKVADISNTKESAVEDNAANEQKNQLHTNQPTKETLKLELTETNKGDIKDTAPPSINRYQTHSSLVPSECNLHSLKQSHASTSVFTVASEATCGKSSSTEIDGSAKRLSENSDPISTHQEVDTGSITGNRGELRSEEKDKRVSVSGELCKSDVMNNQVPDSSIGSINSQGTKLDENVRNETVIAGSSSGDYGTGNQNGRTGKSDLQNAPVESDKSSEIDSVGVSRNGTGGVSKQEVIGGSDRNDRLAPVSTKAVKQAEQHSNGKLEKLKVNTGFQQSRTPIKEHKISQNTGASVSYKIYDKKKSKPALAIHAQNIEVPEMQTKNKDVKTSNSYGNQGVIYYHNQSSQPGGNNVNYSKNKNQELNYSRPETYTKQNILGIKKSEKMNNDVILQKPVLVRPKSAGLSAFAMYESEDLWSVNTGEEDDDRIEFIDGEQDFFKVFGYDEDTAAILMATKVYPISDAIKKIEETETGTQNVGKPNSGSSSVSGNIVGNGAKLKTADGNDDSATKSNNVEVSKDPGVGYSMSTKNCTKKNVIPRADNQSKLTKTTGKQNIESSKNDADRSHGYQTVPVHPDNKRTELTDTKNNSLNATVNIPKITTGNNAQPQTKIALVKAGPKIDKKVVENKDITPSNKATLSKLNEKQSTNQKQVVKGVVDSKPKPQNTQTSRQQQPNPLPAAAATMTLLSEREHAAIQDHVMRRRFHSEADIGSVNPNTGFADAKGHSNASRTNFASQNNNNYDEKFGYQKRHVRHKSLATNVTQTTNNNPRQSRESMDTLQSTHGNAHADAKNFKGRHFYRQTQLKTNDEPTRLADKLTSFNPYTHAADRIMSRFSDTENAINGRNSNSSSDNNMSQSPGASSNNTISTISKTSTDLYHVTKTTGNAGRRMSHPGESRTAHAHQAEVVLAPKQPRKLKPIIHQPATQRFNNNFSTGLR